MACSTCGPVKQYLPPPPPLPVAPNCENSERCFEVQDAACVAYTGQPLEFLGISTNDRLNQALEKMNDAFAKVGEGIVYLEGSRQIEVVGKGSAEYPYYIRPILVPVDNNLLRATRDGLSVVIDEDEVSRLLQLIKTTPALQAIFCDICGPLTPLICQALLVSLSGISSLDELVPGTARQALSWTELTDPTGALPLLVKSRRKSALDPAFSVVGEVLPSLAGYLLRGLTPNILYQVKVMNQCSETSISASNLVEVGHPLAVGTVTKTSAAGGATVSFAHLGGDVDAYSIELSQGDLLTPKYITKSLPFPGGLVSHTFAGLTAGEQYHVEVSTHLGAFRQPSDKGLVTVVGTAVPPPSSTCANPTGLTATLS